MRVVTYLSSSGSGVGVLAASDDDRVLRTPFINMIELITAGDDGLEQLRAAQAAGDEVLDPRLTAPIPRPPKMLFSGVNYHSHSEENPDGALPEHPEFFSKLPTSVCGPFDDIVNPYPDAQLDYEVELAVVIGRGGVAISREDALSHVFGYTVVNDVSERKYQLTDKIITLGKGLDTLCPMGPWIVLPDEVPDPSTLHVRCIVNGEERQSAPTSNLIFDVPRLIEYYSRYITLEPGDVIGTGTPGGVGYFVEPFGAGFLRPGDTLETEVEGIGRLRNRVVAGW